MGWLLCLFSFYLFKLLFFYFILFTCGPALRLFMSQVSTVSIDHYIPPFYFLLSLFYIYLDDSCMFMYMCMWLGG